MSDPIEDAFKSLHQGNLLAAKDARIKQLEDEVKKLHNAGDLVAFHYIALGKKYFPNDMMPPSINDWLIAKDGKANG
jgi:hypothetical protein